LKLPTAVRALCAIGCGLAVLPFNSSLRGQSPEGKLRVYYVAADEIQWDYAPAGREEAMGHPFDELQKGYCGVRATQNWAHL